MLSIGGQSPLCTDKASISDDVCSRCAAGIASGGLSETYTPEQLRDLFEVNVFGVHRVIRAALPEMQRHNSGLIINVGSILGRLTLPFYGLYGRG